MTERQPSCNNNHFPFFYAKYKTDSLEEHFILHICSLRKKEEKKREERKANEKMWIDLLSI